MERDKMDIEKIRNKLGLRKGAFTLLIIFAIANILDILSTLYFTSVDGGWHSEANVAVAKLVAVGVGNTGIIIYMVAMKAIFIYIMYRLLKQKTIAGYKNIAQITIVITAVMFFAVFNNFSHDTPTPRETFYQDETITTSTGQNITVSTQTETLKEAKNRTMMILSMMALLPLILLGFYDWLLNQDYAQITHDKFEKHFKCKTCGGPKE